MQAHSPPQPMPQMHPPPPQPYLGHPHQQQQQQPLPSAMSTYPLMPGFGCPPPPPGFPLGMAGGVGPPRRKNATKETTALLKVWLNAHKTNPYPTKQEKVFLAVMSQMSMTQVSTWFANARRRLKKENKMTWAPRNRCDDDDDDDEDEEDDDQISVDLEKEDLMNAQRESPQKPPPQQHQQQIAPQTPPMLQQQQQQAQNQFPHLHPLHPHHPHHQLYSLMAAHHAAMQAAALAAAQAQQQQQLQQHRQSQQQQSDSCGKHPYIWRPYA